jgi:archaellum component FlaF (FlaF/FlaG flagellin family)
MKKRFAILLLQVLFTSAVLAQNNDSLFSRLQAIINNGTSFFNVDGIEITSQNINAAFSKKPILKAFKRFGIKEADLTTADSSIQAPNFIVSKLETITEGTIQYTAYYFIENANKEITAITFAYINKTDNPFEHHFISLLLNNQIPASLYAAISIDSINFSGRKIRLGSSCRWMGINNVQCPYYGQMNWSVHQTLEDAAQSVHNQYTVITMKRGGKIISEDSVDVIFEGHAVKAKKAVYDFKGIKSLLVGMSGGKTLTIYFVASPAAKNFVSCVMSFWNNDSIGTNGLPALLEEVMQLKK